MTNQRSRAPTARVAMSLAALTALLASTAVAAPSTPVVTAPQDGALLNVSDVEIAGSVDGSTVEVFILEGSTVRASTGVAGGSFRVTVAMVADGPHTFLVRARDAGGSFGPDASVAFTVDTIAPAAPVITAPAAGATIAHSPVTIEGTAEALSRVSVRDLGTGSRYDTTASAGGAWLVSAAIGDGNRAIAATAIDAAGNVSPLSPTRSFTVDTLAPAAPIVNLPAEGSDQRFATIPVEGVAEPGSTVRISEGALLATLVANGDASWRTTLTFTEGSHTLRVRTTDAAGWPSAETVRTFNVDLTPPLPPTILTPLQKALVGPVNIVVTGRAEPFSSVFVLRGDVQVASAATNNDGNWVAVIALAPDGDNEITARARDHAGNLGPASEIRKFVVDATPPSITIATPDGSLFVPFVPGGVGGLPQIEGTASDDRGLLRIELTFFDILEQVVMSNVAICSSCLVLKDDVYWRSGQTPLVGRFRVTAHAVDLVGNRSGDAQVTVTIVRTP